MKAKNTLMFLLVILTGAVIGGLIAQLVQGVPWLEWLAYGSQFGISVDEPLMLDLAVLKVKFGIIIDINIATVIGIVAALLIYRKLV